MIGSGGKTTLIWHLAASFAAPGGRKILVAPTTKMFPPAKNVQGVSLAGSLNEASGKLESLPLSALEKIISGYDLVLLEGDGAKELPLKAWTSYEPVVPPFTTLTIGVLPLWPLGKPVSENLVHRLPLFLELTGAVLEEPLKPEHFVTLITGSKTRPGLFAKAQGKTLLFFNGLEDAKAAEQAFGITSRLPEQFRDGLSGIIVGSAGDDRIVEL